MPLPIPTATVRTVFMPQTGYSLSVGVTEPTARVREVAAAPQPEGGPKGPELEAALVEVSSRVLTAPRNRFVSFSAWRQLLDMQLEIVGEPNFREQLVASYAGGSRKLQARFAALLDGHRNHLESLKWQFRDAGGFALGMINRMLVPAHAPSGRNLQHYLVDLADRLAEVEEDRGDAYFFLTLSWDMMKRGVTEVELADWSRLSNLLSAPTYHSAKEVFDEVQRVEIPAAGSADGRPFAIGDLNGATLVSAGAITGGHYAAADDGASMCPVVACLVGPPADLIVYVSPGLYLVNLLGAVAAGQLADAD